MANVEYVVQKPSEYGQPESADGIGWDSIAWNPTHKTQLEAVKVMQGYPSRPARIIARKVVEAVVVCEMSRGDMSTALGKPSALPARRVR